MDYSSLKFGDRVDALLGTLKAKLDLSSSIPESLPDVLWHYTGPEGVRAILTNHTLRLSHARYLNDPTEVAYGWRKAAAALKEAREVAGNLQDFFEMTHSVTGEVYNAPEYFIFCMSGRPDSLSQWRAYGAGGAGYALGFNAKQILQATEPDVTCVLLRMIYKQKEQDALLAKGVTAARTFWK